MSLTAYERETILLYSQAESEASVYTHNKTLKKRLEKLARKFPDQFRLERTGSQGEVTYIIPKKCITIREPVSEERRQAARERALSGHYTPPNRSKNPKS